MRRVLLALVLLAACAPPRAVGWYDAANDQSHIDAAVLAEWEASWPGMGEWWPAHEDGHGDYLLLFRAGVIDFGAGIIGQERGAQCMAELALGHGPSWTDETAGYWDCPEWALEQIRRADAGRHPGT